MRKLLKSMKTLLLVAAGLCAGTNAWGATSTWNYSTTLSNNTIGSSFEGSTSGIVSVQLGADGDGANWKVLNTNNNNRGLAHKDNSVTLTDNVPTAGTFVKVTATQKVQFVLNFYRAGTGYFRLIDASAPSTNILNERNGGAGGNKTATATLTAGHTYYIYYSEDKAGEGNFSIRGFTATTFATYTINYTYGGNIIKSEAETEGYEGQKVTASLTSMWDDGKTTKYYVADNATTEFTVADGTNNFEVALRLAATDAVATVNAVDANGTVLKSFTATGVEGEVKDFIYYTRAVYYNGKYYAVTANNGNGRNYAKADVVYGGEPETVTYTLDESITYYAEAENLQISRSYAASGSAPERASGGDWKRLYENSYAYTKSGDLTAGVYTLEVSSRNQSGKNSESLTIEVRNSDKTIYNTIGTLEWGAANNSVQTKNFIIVPSNCSVAIDNTTDYNSNIGIDYIILRKLYDVTDASKIVGAVDYTTGYMAAATESLPLTQGKKVVYTFQNHGKNAANYNNWALEMSGKYNGNDFVYGWAGGSHVNTWGEANANTNSVTTDGASMDWTTHNAEMMDCPVTVTVNYYNNGIFALKSEAKSASHTYNTWFAYNNAQSGNIGLRLGVDASWLEVQDIVTDDATVDVTIGSAGWATLYTPTAVSFEGSGLTAYTATLEGSTVNLTPVTTVPANTGVVLKGAAKTYNLPEIASSSTAQGDLQGSIAGATFFDENTNRYVLALNANNEVQFTKLGSGFVTAGKAFLVVAGGSGQAKSLNVMFAADPTGIANVNAAETVQPVKRIVNGQLVIEKNGKRYNAAGAEF